MTFDARMPYDLSIESFADVPEAERPTFKFRRINGPEYLRLSSVFDLEGQNASECGPQLYAALSTGLIGWSNQYNPATGEKVEFDPAKLSEVIDPVDAFYLIRKRLNRNKTE